jgi:hypothetical protein
VFHNAAELHRVKAAILWMKRDHQVIRSGAARTGALLGRPRRERMPARARRC